MTRGIYRYIHSYNTYLCIDNPIHPGSNTHIEIKLFTGLRSVQMF